jgi:hypothetical protein
MRAEPLAYVAHARHWAPSPSPLDAAQIPSPSLQTQARIQVSPHLWLLRTQILTIAALDICPPPSPSPWLQTRQRGFLTSPSPLASSQAQLIPRPCPKCETAGVLNALTLGHTHSLAPRSIHETARVLGTQTLGVAPPIPTPSPWPRK